MHPQTGIGAALAHPVGAQVGSAPAVTLKWSKRITAAAPARHKLQQ